jgi:hypothetical protein
MRTEVMKMFKELAKNRTEKTDRQEMRSTVRIGSYRELLDLDREAVKALHMKAYGYDYDHALDIRELA